MRQSAMSHVALDGEALEQQLTNWRAEWPQMGILALLPEAEKAQLPSLQARCRQLGIPLHGAIFPSLVTESGFVTHGVCLLRLDQQPAAAIITGLGNEAASDATQIAQQLSPLIPASSGIPPTLFMIFDAMVPNIGSILDGLYLTLSDRVRYVGVNGGSETFQPLPCLFDSKNCYQNAVLALLLPEHPGTVMAHGYPVPQRLVTATSTDGNRINSLNWQPAFEMYKELIASEYGILDLTQENFYQYACHFPFGILRADDEVVVRIPVALTDDGALYCVGEVPANAVLVLLRAPAPGTTACVAEVSHYLQTQGTPAATPLLVFYCAGRRMHLGDDASRELNDLKRHIGCTEMVGALSLGEIGSAGAWEYPCFHNATIVVTPWSAP